MRRHTMPFPCQEENFEKKKIVPMLAIELANIID